MGVAIDGGAFVRYGVRKLCRHRRAPVRGHWHGSRPSVDLEEPSEFATSTDLRPIACDTSTLC